MDDQVKISDAISNEGKIIRIDSQQAREMKRRNGSGIAIWEKLYLIYFLRHIYQMFHGNCCSFAENISSSFLYRSGDNLAVYKCWQDYLLAKKIIDYKLIRE